MTSEEVWEVPLDEETKRLGKFSRAYVKSHRMYIDNAKDEPISFPYIATTQATIFKSINELGREALFNTGEYDNEVITKLCIGLMQALVKYVQAQKAQPTNREDLESEIEGDESKEENVKTAEQILAELEDELVSSHQIPDKDYVEYLIQTSKCTVKQEDQLIRQITYTAISKDTKNPINLAVMAPTSEGKTHAVQETLQPFPLEDVQMIGSISPRVIIRQNGILVDNNNQPMQDKIKELKKKIREGHSSQGKRKFGKSNQNQNQNQKGQTSSIKNPPVDIEEVEEELNRLYDEAKVLINLEGKLLVFLEPPHHETWTILKPILSHDSFEIEHPYVYDAGKGFKVKKVVTRGWPACIFCSAKNESDWPVWPEIQSRFLVTSPNMVQQKYSDGNMLIAQRMGLPSLLQQELIISDAQIELAKKCARYILGQVKRYSSKTPVWIPYTEILGQVLPAQKGTDNRITKRIYSFLVIITLARAHLRGRFEYGNEILPIADIDNDLREVLHITQNVSGIPPFKLRVFKEVFLPLYKEKLEKSTPKPKQEDNKQEKLSVEEKSTLKPVDGVGLTTKEICQYYKQKIGRSISTDSIKKTYLNEFLENGLIDESKLDGRQNTYSPIIDLDFDFDPVKDEDGEEKMSNSSNMNRFDIFLQDPKIIVSNNCKKIPENWLELHISTLLKCRISQGVQTEFALYDKDGKRSCVCNFVKSYRTLSMIRYFSKPIFDNSYKERSEDLPCLSTTIGEVCKKISNGARFDEFDISQSQDKENTIPTHDPPMPSETIPGQTSETTEGQNSQSEQFDNNTDKESATLTSDIDTVPVQTSPDTTETEPSESATLTSDINLQQRRLRIKELIEKKYSQREVAKMLCISEMTVRRDLKFLSESATNDIGQDPHIVSGTTPPTTSTHDPPMPSETIPGQTPTAPSEDPPRLPKLPEMPEEPKDSIDVVTEEALEPFQKPPKESWNPIASVEDLFGNDIPSKLLRSHDYWESPCYHIINTKYDEISTQTLYCCKLHPDMIPSTFVTQIELHCREKEPERHKAEILRIIGESA